MFSSNLVDVLPGFRTRIYTLFFIILSTLLFALPATSPARGQNQPPPPILNDNAGEEIATAGFYTLRWDIDLNEAQPITFEVQESPSESFESTRIVYAGPDRATTLSGKSDGAYYYRVRALSTDDAPASSWSPAYHVEVAHHALPRALLFLGLGAVVFLTTLVTILRGHAGESAFSVQEA